MPVPGNEHPSGFEPITVSLAHHAEHDGPAFTFVDFQADRNGVEWTIGWTELYQRARAVAVRLAQVTAPGARVALVCPQNLDYVVGFLGALDSGRILGPLYAP